MFLSRWNFCRETARQFCSYTHYCCTSKQLWVRVAMTKRASVLYSSSESWCYTEAIVECLRPLFPHHNCLTSFHFVNSVVVCFSLLDCLKGQWYLFWQAIFKSFCESIFQTFDYKKFGKSIHELCNKIYIFPPGSFTGIYFCGS
jgi:hypothetical protein